MNAPDPPRWTLNSCIAAFRSVWVHFGLFRYCTKLGAKGADLVQLMQKFVPRSRIRIFRNEHTRSTPLDPKLMFWCVSYCLGAFGNISLQHETRCKTDWSGAINAQVCAMKSHRNFSQQNAPNPPHWTLNSCIGAFCSGMHFWLFRYCTKLYPKRAELVQLMKRFVPRSRLGIFRNERTRSTPLDPKLMFWCIS